MIGAVIFAGANAATAQVVPDERTVAYFSSKPYAEAIIMMGLILDKEVLGKARCEGSYGFDPISFSIREPLSFKPELPHPVSGTWTYRFAFKRCGEIKVYNLQWTAKPSGGLPTPSELPPGSSRVSQSLFRDLRNGVGSAGLLKYGAPKECRSLKIVDTRVTSDPKSVEVDGVVREGVWEEQWDAKMCEYTFTADICLVPVGNGATNWSVGKCGK